MSGIAQPPLVLRPLRVDDESQALAAEAELTGEFEFLPLRNEGESWVDFVARIDAQRFGEGLPPGFVPGTFLVAEVDGTIVGCVGIRHELNDALRAIGGHIGYGVRPSWRRRGYATEMLHQSLAVCSDLGIERALVTCDDTNLASAAVIERCGGVLENTVPNPHHPDLLKRRYWIATSQ